MSKKPVKYVIGLALLFLLGYNSVYFKKLDQVKLAAIPANFNASDFSVSLWKEKMTGAIANAIDLQSLDSMLTSDPQTAFKNSNSLSIGNYRYFFVRTTGIVDSVTEDDVALSIQPGIKPLKATVATEFIYGNAIRDASKMVSVNDFANSKDLNDISAELNGIVRKTVIPPFRAAVKNGDKVEVIGAIEVNKAHVRLDGIEIIPVQLKIVN